MDNSHNNFDGSKNTVERISESMVKGFLLAAVIVGMVCGGAVVGVLVILYNLVR